MSTLTAFATCWGTEGAGARWPGSDAAMLVLIPAIALFAVGLTALFRCIASRAPEPPAVLHGATAPGRP